MKASASSESTEVHLIKTAQHGIKTDYKGKQKQRPDLFAINVKVTTTRNKEMQCYIFNKSSILMHTHTHTHAHNQKYCTLTHVFKITFLPESQPLSPTHTGIQDSSPYTIHSPFRLHHILLLVAPLGAWIPHACSLSPLHHLLQGLYFPLSLVTLNHLFFIFHSASGSPAAAFYFSLLFQGSQH